MPLSFMSLSHWFKQLWTRDADPVAVVERHPGLVLSPPTAALSRAELELLGETARCFGCGRCDTRFDYTNADRTSMRGPSDFALRYAKAPDDYGLLQPLSATFERGNLAELEAACPARVPFVAIGALLALRAAALAPPPPLPPPDKSANQHDPG